MQVEILEDGTVKVKYGTDPFTIPQGSWKIEGDKITVSIKDKTTGTIVVYIMIRTEFGWTNEAGTEVMSEPVRTHVTKEEASVMGEWKFTFGMTSTGQVRFTDTYKVQFKPEGGVWGPETGYWKVTSQGKVKCEIEGVEYTLIIYDVIGGFKVEGENIAIIEPELDYDPYFGKPDAAVLGEWSWGADDEKIYFTENGKIKYTDGKEPWTPDQGSWKWDGDVLVIIFNDFEWKLDIQLNGTFVVDPAKNPTITDPMPMRDPILEHTPKDPAYGKPEAEVIGEWFFEVTKTADPTATGTKEKIVLLDDGTVKVRHPKSDTDWRDKIGRAHV